MGSAISLENSVRCRISGQSFMISSVASLQLLWTIYSSFRIYYEGSNQLVNIFCLFLLGSWTCIFFVALLAVPLDKKKHLIFFELLYGILLLMALDQGNQQSPFWGGYCFRFMGIALPLGIVFSCIQDRRKFLNVITKISYINSIFTIITLIVFKWKGIITYDMSLGYALTFSTLFTLNNAFEKKRFSFILPVISIIVLLLCASRGALICIFLFSLTKLKFRYILLGGVVLLSFYFLKPILREMYEQSGYNIRTIDLLLKEEVHMSGREEIYEKCWEQINERPWIGNGVAGFRDDEFYPHSIFLEIWLTFGYIIGSLLNVAICIIIFRILRERKDSSLVIYSCFAFGQLLFSGSLFMSFYFFLCIYGFFALPAGPCRRASTGNCVGKIA